MAGFASAPRYSLQLKWKESGTLVSKSRTFSGINVATDPTTTLRSNGYNYTDLENFAQLYFTTSPTATETSKYLIENRQITNYDPEEGE